MCEAQFLHHVHIHVGAVEHRAKWGWGEVEMGEAAMGQSGNGTK